MVKWARALFLGGMLVSAPARAERLEAVVVRVIDGDTLDVRALDQRRYRVRLGAIDAPEMAQAYGQESKRHLRALALREHVTVNIYKRDSNGRAVGDAWVAAPGSCPQRDRHCARGLDLGLTQVRAGLAWHYQHYSREQDARARAAYAAAQRDARASRKGLWARPKRVPPWQWRHGGP